jgi:hypothetical protein
MFKSRMNKQTKPCDPTWGLYWSAIPYPLGFGTMPSPKVMGLTVYQTYIYLGYIDDLNDVGSGKLSDPRVLGLNT